MSGICFTLLADGLYHGTAVIGGIGYPLTISGSSLTTYVLSGSDNGQTVPADPSSTCSSVIFISVVLGGVSYTLRVDNNNLCCGSSSSSSPSSSSSSLQSSSSVSQSSVSSSSSSSSGGVTTACCSNAIPTTLYITLTNIVNCPCAGGTIALTYNAITNKWTGTGAFGSCGHNITFSLYCTTNWFLDFSWPDGCAALATVAQTNTVCSPFSVTFQNIGNSGCGCAGGPNVQGVVTT